MRSTISPTTSLKLRRRSVQIVASSANTLLLPLMSPLVSLLVVRLASPELWGAFVGVAIITQLGAHVVGWGNKEYLLRQFSRNPAGLAAAWQTSLLTRLALFAGFGVAAALLASTPTLALLMAVWCLALALDQSYDVVVQYRKAFLFATLVELGSLGALAAVVAALGAALTLETLVGLFAAAHLLQALALAYRFRRVTLPGMAARFEGGYFRAALPFFLLGLSGLLQSRVDLYTASALLPPPDVAQYQVLTSLLIYVQTIAYFVLAPFARSIYRMREGAIAKLTLRLVLFGLLIVVPALAAIYGALTVLYRFDVAPLLLVVGGVFVLPAFWYLPTIYSFYRENRQGEVLAINVLGAATSLGLSLLLMPRLGLAGGIAAAATAQWTMLGLYAIRRRSLRGGQAHAVSELS